MLPETGGYGPKRSGRLRRGPRGRFYHLLKHMGTAHGASKRYPYAIETGQPHSETEKVPVRQEKIKILGHVIEGGCLKPDPEKVEAIDNYPTPKTKRQVRAFLGLGNFYNRFIPDVGTKAAPLTELIRKDRPDKVHWTDATEQAFKTLKEDLTSDRMLIPADVRKPFILRCDTSGTGIGSVLAQVDINGLEPPIGYASRKLIPREANMSTVERELLSVVWSLNHFQQFTYGTRVHVYTDHNCLKWLQTMANHNPRLTRWALALQRYDLDIHYIPGRHNEMADALSRANQPN